MLNISFGLSTVKYSLLLISNLCYCSLSAIYILILKLKHEALMKKKTFNLP